MEHKLPQESYLRVMTAGRSIVTLRNKVNGNRFTYRITIPGDQRPEEATIWFVAGLTGSDNTTNYSYFGHIRRDKVTGQFHFEIGRKSRIPVIAPIVTGFEFVFNKIVAPGKISNVLEIWHEGKCCRCGRKLTVPESIESGIGPECARIMERYLNHV